MPVENSNRFDQSIGERALKFEFINQKQLSRALLLQKKVAESGKALSIESIMLQEKMISNKQLEFLNTGKKLYETRQKDMQFGTVAKKMGLIAQEKLDWALNIQIVGFKKQMAVKTIGDILVENKLITENDRQKILEEQNRLKTDLQPPSSKSDELPDKLPNDLIGKKQVVPKEKKETKKEESPPISPSPTRAAKKSKPVLEITITPDQQEAYLEIKEGAIQNTSLAEIKALIDQKQIVHGVLSDKALNNIIATKSDQKKFKIAVGTPVKPGTDPMISFVYDKKEKQSDDEDATLKPGEVIAEKIAGVKGIDGMDIFGNIMPAPSLERIEISCGYGVKLSKDQMKCIATIKGNPKITFDNTFYVLPNRKISEDYTVKTYTSKFEGNLTIEGTLSTTKELKCGDISAEEIRNTKIFSVGDIVTESGIVGANIQVEGSVRAKYIIKSKIEAFGGVHVDLEIMDSQIASSQTCTVSRGKVLGSLVAGKQGVNLFAIGSRVSEPCEIKIGVDENINRKVLRIDTEINKIIAHIEKLEEDKQQMAEQNNAWSKEIKDLASQVIRLDTASGTLEDQKKALEQDEDKAGQRKLQMQIDKAQKRIKKFENSISNLKRKQAKNKDTQLKHDDKIAGFNKEITGKEARKSILLNWAQKTPGNPILKAKSRVYEDTIITGPHKSHTIPKTIRNITAIERENQETPDDEKWAIEIIRAQAKQAHPNKS